MYGLKEVRFHALVCAGKPFQPKIASGIEMKLVPLQVDELHLNAGGYLWLEWFPCTDEGVEADFFESVHGLLSGRFRIVEHHRRGSAFKAVLERPINRGWESYGTWHSPSLPIG